MHACILLAVVQDISCTTTRMQCDRIKALPSVRFGSDAHTLYDAPIHWHRVGHTRARARALTHTYASLSSRLISIGILSVKLFAVFSQFSFWVARSRVAHVFVSQYFLIFASSNCYILLTWAGKVYVRYFSEISLVLEIIRNRNRL